MSKGTNWTLADANKNKLVLVGDKLVKSDKLVADKVEKIEPTLIEQSAVYQKQIEDSQRRIKAMMNLNNSRPVKDLSMAMAMNIMAHEKLGWITLPNGELIKPLFTFDITPCAAPRMTVSDKWKTDPHHINPSKRQRAFVQRYFEFASNLRRQCEVNGYKLTSELNILFVVPMADTWSKNRKALKNGRPHVQRPDWDNLAKAFCDSLSGEDNFVWNVRVIKIWGYTGKIIIF